MEKNKIINIPFSNCTLDEAVNYALLKIKNGDKFYVVTPNAEIAYDTITNEELSKTINNASLILPDGIGVVIASKILKTPLKQKVAGVEFAENIVKTMANENMRLFILGGASDVAKKACENLQEKYLGLKIAGYRDGFYEDENEIINIINESQADVVFVCLGCPKQEKFIEKHLMSLNVSMMCGIGGSVDVFAGTVKRAPKIFVKLGLEWFYRLLCQPSRIKRMVKLPLYIIEVMKFKKEK